MSEERLLLIVAVAAVLVSVVAAGFTYFSIVNLASRISGYATSTGQANLSIGAEAVINFSTSFINWGSGRVNTGQTVAQLTTLETNNVTNGNWTLVQSGGFKIENIGNSNVTLDLLAGKTSASFIGGTNPGYQWNVSNVEASSCTNASALGLWANVNTTSPGTRFCSVFLFQNANDLIRIDINLSVPYDATTGALTDTLTATATAI